MPLHNVGRNHAVAAAALLLLSGSTSAVAFADAGALDGGTPNIAFVAGDGAVVQVEDSPFHPSFTGLVPGGSVANDVFVYNSGDAAAHLDLLAPIITNVTAPAGELLQDKITVTIVDSHEGRVLYQGPLTEASFSDLELEVGRAEGVPLSITATLDDDASEATCGQQIRILMTFSAHRT